MAVDASRSLALVWPMGSVPNVAVAIHGFWEEILEHYLNFTVLLSPLPNSSLLCSLFKILKFNF
jgi:hypothetical protein